MEGNNSRSRDPLGDIYNLRRDMENINQAVGAGMTEGEYSRNFLVKIILTCYIFECVGKVHLRGYGKKKRLWECYWKGEKILK